MAVVQQQLTLTHLFCHDVQVVSLIFFQQNYRVTTLKVIFFLYFTSLADNFSSKPGL